MRGSLDGQPPGARNRASRSAHETKSRIAQELRVLAASLIKRRVTRSGEAACAVALTASRQSHERQLAAGRTRQSLVLRRSCES